MYNLRYVRLRSELDRILDTLRIKYSPETIILFGSLADGSVKETSDIDLVIIKETKKRFIDRIGEVIKICKPTVAVDFIVYTPAEFNNLKDRGKFIKEEIIEKGKVVYEKKG